MSPTIKHEQKNRKVMVSVAIFLLILIPILVFLYFYFFDIEKIETDISKISENELNTTISGYWVGSWVQTDVHYNDPLPELEYEEIDYWDPESQKTESDKKLNLELIIDKENFVSISNTEPKQITFTEKYEFSFESDWDFGREIRWYGNISKDFSHIEGFWELHHPIHGLMSSGAWGVKKQ